MLGMGLPGAPRRIPQLVEADSARTPVSYWATFIGFVGRYLRNINHELGR